MDALEKISEQKKCMFVDLFVRVSNAVAITMYRVSEPYPLMCSIRSLPIFKVHHSDYKFNEQSSCRLWATWYIERSYSIIAERRMKMHTT